MKTNDLIFYGVVIVLVLAVGGLIVVGFKSPPKETAPPKMDQQNSSPSALKIEDLTVGTGSAAQNGDTVTVNYVGTLTNGTKFDSSYDRNQPFKFTLGAGQVIQGWDQGVLGMKVGGKRRLTIPPELGYGPQGAGAAIPPNSTLVFEVELLDASK